ncbi:MAG: hypothetical protein NWT00_02050 [Beijerinckiaceae bacterium]|jgi:hypothetical protein|nr:hypothetical protein [Beijerinckiaceae bacterium]
MADTDTLPSTRSLIAFESRTYRAGYSSFEIASAGQGQHVLYIGAGSDTLAQLLAADFAVHAFAADETFASFAPAAKAQHLAVALEAMALTGCSVIAAGPDAQALVHLAAGAPDMCSSNVMIAPAVFDETGVLLDPALAEKLEKITSHTLALFGTDSGGAAVGGPSNYRQKIPNCHLMYVFDAPDPLRDRPQAAASVIADFLRRGDGFLVNEKDGRIHA